jgi:hypothetical protein
LTPASSIYNGSVYNWRHEGSQTNLRGQDYVWLIILEFVSFLEKFLSTNLTFFNGLKILVSVAPPIFMYFEKNIKLDRYTSKWAGQMVLSFYSNKSIVIWWWRSFCLKKCQRQNLQKLLVLLKYFRNPQRMVPSGLLADNFYFDYF